MKKIKPILCLILFFSIVISCRAFADSPKVITLKDGSVMQGELVSFQNGIYTIQTQNLGLLQIPEANVVSVAAAQGSPRQPQGEHNDHGDNRDVGNDHDGDNDHHGDNGHGAYQGQVDDIKNQIANNPQLLEAIMALGNDPEITAIVADPALFGALTDALAGRNLEATANNPQIQKLMANPKMQAIVQQIHGKSAGSGQ